MEKEKILNFLTKFLLFLSLTFIYLGINNFQKGYTGCDQKLSCYSKFYTDIVNKYGVPKAFEILKKDYRSNSYAVKQCHSLTHIIGHAGYNLYPDVTIAFNNGDSFCWSGYYHGVMEELVTKIGPEGLKQNINSICSKVSGKETHSFNYYNCVHGLGHGVMSISNNELFESLVMCDLLSGEYERQNCYGGVYMENVVQDGNFGESKYLKKDDLIYPCDAVESKYKKPCLLMQPTYILSKNHRDFAKTFELCRNFSGDLLAYCLDGIGRESLSQVENSKNADVEKVCNTGINDLEKSACYDGAVKNMIAYYHSDRQANKLCIELPENIKNHCLNTVTDYYKNF